MTVNITYPALLITSGILAAAIVILFLTRISNKITRYFEFYPETKKILKPSLKIVTWFIGATTFLIFLHWGLMLLGLEFTTALMEKMITALPQYLLAVFLVLFGFYVSRIVKERSVDYTFEYKDRVILGLDLIIHMTFIFTALYTIGINVMFFLTFYTVLLWVIGATLGVIISMTIGIPLGMSIFETMSKEEKKSKKAK
jgi:hypothetical protein